MSFFIKTNHTDIHIAKFKYNINVISQNTLQQITYIKCTKICEFLVIYEQMNICKKSKFEKSGKSIFRLMLHN